MPLPHLTLLTPAHCAEVHAASLHILETAGVRVDSPRARDVFLRSGGCRLVEDRLYLDPALVESALQSAPSSVQIFDRRGELAFTLGADSSHPAARSTRFGVGVTNLYYQDPATESITPFTRPILASCVRLGDVLPGFDVVSTIGILHDQPPHLADLYAVLEMLANTRKALVILISDESLVVDR